MITITSQETGENELIMYTPHSIYMETAKQLEEANPRLKTLALLHGLDETWFGLDGGLGTHNGLKLVRLTGAKYWVQNHDEVHEMTGLPTYILSRKKNTVEDAVMREGGERGGLNYVKLENGESMLLN